MKIMINSHSLALHSEVLHQMLGLLVYTLGIDQEFVQNLIDIFGEMIGAV